MAKTLTIGAMAAVAAATLPLGIATAHAQSYDDDSIVVQAPYVEQTGRTPYGAPIETYSVSSPVYYGDLDLASYAGRRELRYRVADTAGRLCRQLTEEMRPEPGQPPESQCVSDAIASADGQMDYVMGY
jgi:UrcA family protein